MNIIHPTAMFDLSRETRDGIERLGIDWCLSTTYGSSGLEKWFSYLHQYQTFLLKTAGSEYTMLSYY